VKIALIDNGSLEPAAHESLRAAALAIGERTGVAVEAVSWKHSDRIAASSLKGGAARVLAAWVCSQVASGEREFLFIPFFVSPQGAIGSALRMDLEALQAEAGRFDFSFTDSLSGGDALAAIVADLVREAARANGLRRPAVIVVDHGGPSRNSSVVRDRVADAVRAELGGSFGRLSPASMESPQGPEFDFNRPLLCDALGSREVVSGDVVIAPLFLSPGRHAGPGGDLERIARAAEDRSPGLRCHFTKLVGSHPLAVETLAGALARALPAGALP
jgi:sirohydrochlorin ferrochelatase